jgi:hypothetical protein
MGPSMTTILHRFTGERAALLPAEAILTVCQEIGETAWRDRVRTPVPTVQVCLVQMLPGPTAGRQLPHRSGVRCRAARRRAPAGRFPARSAVGQAACAADICRQRRAPLPRAQRARRPRPPGGVGETADRSLVAPPGDLRRPARFVRAPSGALPDRPAGVPDPREHPGHHAARRGGLPPQCSRRALPPALAGRDRARAAQDPQADGRVVRQTRGRRAARTAEGCHRLPPGAPGHGAIGDPPPPRRGAEQCPRGPAGAPRAKYRPAMTGGACQPCPPPSCGAARQEAAAQELPVDDHTPASTASAVSPARARRLTSCHSAKSHYQGKIAS